MGAVLRQEPFRRTTLALAFLAGLGTACRSGDAPRPAAPAGVGIGDRAPPLDIADWVHRGTARPTGPVTAFQPGTIYVLEFWATWCEHSRAAVPVLAALQERFADDGVVVIGLTIESPESLRGFLADGDLDVRDLAARAGRYGLVVDPDGSVQEAFMDAIGEVSIPTAFLIGRDGRVEWIGHPADLVDPLEQVVAGTWDRTAFASRWSQLQAARACLAGIPIPLPEDRAAEVAAIVDRFIAAHATETLALNEVAWLIVERADFGRIPDAVLAAAERAAARSVSQATTDGNHLDTLAHLQALRGDMTAAIATQKRAVEHGGADTEHYRAFLSELEVMAAGRDNAP